VAVIAPGSRSDQTTPSAAFLSFVQLIVWPLLLVTAALTYADPDLWGHVRFGQDILVTRTLPSVDPYSFTQDRPWVNHEWLSEVAMAICYRVGGTVGLVGLKILIVGLALLIIFRHLSSSVPPLLSAAGLAVVVWGAFPLTTTVRPQLWTFLGLAVLMSTLVRNPRPWWLPLIFAVWSNLHGGWIVGLGVVWLWTLGQLHENPRLSSLGPALVATGATLLNPDGWGLWQFIAETVRLGRQGITEWQPLWLAPPSEWLIWLIVIGMTVWVKPRRLVTWLIVVVLGAASAKVNRLAPLFVEVAVMALAADRKWAIPPVASRERTARGPAIINAIAVGIITVAALVRSLPHLTCLSIESQWAADPGITQALAGRQGRLAVEFNWGEYAIWHLGPQIRVSIDGRRETVYSEATLATQRSLALGRPQGLEWLSITKPEYLWFDASRVDLKKAAQRYGYRIDSDTAHSFLAVRGDLPVVHRQPIDFKTVCFP
jgi:hypothetical protein